MRWLSPVVRLALVMGLGGAIFAVVLLNNKRLAQVELRQEQIILLLED